MTPFVLADLLEKLVAVLAGAVAVPALAVVVR